MINDDPFGPPQLDGTLIIPSPGRRTVRTAPSTPNTPEAPASVEELTSEHGLNPIVAAASALLNAGPPLRTSLNHADPATLHDTLARGIRAFELRAARTGIPPQHVVAARYMLCTFLDEMAASTPWGGSGVWSKYSLLVVFHNETWGGEKVFQLLAKLAENPSANRDLLELMYVILALGFEGRYRVIDNGRSQLDQLRGKLFTMIQQQRGPFEPELSPRWKGLETGRRAFLHLPMWAVFSLIALLALGIVMGLRISLNARSDPVFDRLERLRARPVAVAAPVVQAAPPVRLATLLQPDIVAGKVQVTDYPDRSVVIVLGDGLFESGGTTLAEPLKPVIEDIGKALARVPGSVEIFGHTDDQPIRSLRFKSNYDLSKERADHVREMLSTWVQPGRMKADGHGSAEPLASNATPDGRARNRRVEITLYPSQGT